MEYCLAIGSNWGRPQHMEQARRWLKELFPDIRFSAEEETLPVGMMRHDAFANQVATFHSSWTPAEVVEHLKALERQAGRQPEEKAQEIVRLDLDLLMADQEILRPADVARDYIQRGLKQLLHT